MQLHTIEFEADRYDIPANLVLQKQSIHKLGRERGRKKRRRVKVLRFARTL